jgi:hypothetical protein
MTEITVLAKDYDDPMVIMALKELHRLGVVRMEEFFANLGAEIDSDDFLLPENSDVRPFPEDLAMRGLSWGVGYYPDSWFANEKIDEEEKYHELASMAECQKERIL